MRVNRGSLFKRPQKAINNKVKDTESVLKEIILNNLKKLNKRNILIFHPGEKMKNLLCSLVAMLGNMVAYSGQGTPHFYGVDNHILSPEEKELVDHVTNSFNMAIERKSKLNGNYEITQDRFCSSRYGVIPYYHFLNNVCSLPNGQHLHIGLYTGGSFVSSLYKNQDTLEVAFGIDLFDQNWYKEICSQVCNKYLPCDGRPKRYQIIESDCFIIDKAIFKKPINIYLYDADHSVRAHENAFTYFNEVFANIFIAIIDDWNSDQTRRGTFNAFKKLGYKISYEAEIPAGDLTGNGQYIVVIHK